MKVRVSLKVVRDGVQVTSLEGIFDTQADAMVLFHELQEVWDKFKKAHVE